MAGRRTTRIVAALLVCALLALGGQALADTAADDIGTADAGELIGGTTSSYLTGLKRFAAAALWNRMDPVFHNYYSGVSLDDQLYMLPTIAMVQALDPHLVHPYYIGAWMLVRNDRLDDGIAMAERGVEHNPEAGVLYVNLAQILSLYADDMDQAVEIGERVLDPNMQWTDPVEMHNGYAAVGAVFRQAGRDDLDARIQEAMAQLDEVAGDELEDIDHDHDHDGVPDH